MRDNSMDLKPILDVFLSNNLIITTTFIIFTVFFYSKFYFKIKNKNNDKKIISIFLVFIVTLIFNYIIILLGVRCISSFDNIHNANFVNLIFTYILIISNIGLIFSCNKVYNLLKKKRIDINVFMPIYTIILYWIVIVFFIALKIDFKYLFEGIGHYIMEFIILFFAIIVPLFKLTFNVENYKVIIYMKGFKIPIRLQENIELVKKDDVYIIIYYCKDKSKIVRKDTISIDEVYKIIENYKV
jgi:hypothetical protein